MTSNPVEENDETSTRTRIAMRSLTMKGDVQDKLAYMQKYQSMIAKSGEASILERLQKMEKYYQLNSQQVGDYEEFIQKLWDAGKSGDITAQEVMRYMLESSSISQKLLSAFFYFDPATGKTMMMFPQAHLGQFI